MGRPTRRLGGCIFAEDPSLDAPDARIVWGDALDPTVLPVVLESTAPGDPDGLDPLTLAPWLTVVMSDDGREHAVLSDGFRHVRLDIEAGSLSSTPPLLVHFQIAGVRSAERRLLPLRRFLHLCRHGRFSTTLFPEDAGTRRALELLRVHDALRAGASQRQIAERLFGRERVAGQWSGTTDALRSKVRRLVRDARNLAGGGWRTLLRRP